MHGAASAALRSDGLRVVVPLQLHGLEMVLASRVLADELRCTRLERLPWRNRPTKGSRAGGPRPFEAASAEQSKGAEKALWPSLGGP